MSIVSFWSNCIGLLLHSELTQLMQTWSQEPELWTARTRNACMLNEGEIIGVSLLCMQLWAFAFSDVPLCRSNICQNKRWHSTKMLQVPEGRGFDSVWSHRVFNEPKPISCTMAMEYAQHLTEMSTGVLPGGKPAADILTAICQPIV
jgi:hypothetical protein